MEMTPATPERLLPVLEELRALEPIFHHAEIGSTRAVFEAMTVPEFWEVGASGRRYSRDEVIDTLVDRYSQPHEDHWAAEGFSCTQIAPENYLLTYTLTQDGWRVTRRSTLWRRTPEGWKIVYHQGTMVDA